MYLRARLWLKHLAELVYGYGLSLGLRITVLYRNGEWEAEHVLHGTINAAFGFGIRVRVCTGLRDGITILNYCLRVPEMSWIGFLAF